MAQDRDARAARELLAWFERKRRDLPWRSEPRDAYRTWLSEVMLQQTRVETVVPYFERFLAAFPDARALASAREEDVLKAWEGLGYYSRARNLHAAAKRVAAEGFPRTADALRELPGFGPYTAGAVASLAFGERVAAVDGNVLRVLARFDADATDVATPAARKRAESRALAMQPRDAPGPFNEALMELGALVCVPANPRCGECPLAAGCRARRSGDAERFPVKSAKRPPREVALAAALVSRPDGALLVVRAERGLNAGLWGPPVAEGGWDELAAELRAAGVEGLAGEGVAGRVEHTFTHRRWRVAVHAARARGGPGTWVLPDARERLPLAGWARKALAFARESA